MSDELIVTHHASSVLGSLGSRQEAREVSLGSRQEACEVLIVSNND